MTDQLSPEAIAFVKALKGEFSTPRKATVNIVTLATLAFALAFALKAWQLHLVVQ